MRLYLWKSDTIISRDITLNEQHAGSTPDIMSCHVDAHFDHFQQISLFLLVFLTTLYSNPTANLFAVTPDGNCRLENRNLITHQHQIFHPPSVEARKSSKPPMHRERIIIFESIIFEREKKPKSGLSPYIAIIL